MKRRHFLLSFLFVALTFFGASGQSEKFHLTVLSTTDLHGHIFPIDYYTNQPEDSGLAKIAALVKKVRAEQPNVLLLDSGDTTQGTPLEYYHNRKNNHPPDPMMLVMNELGFDAMAIGNHDFNFGLEVQSKARKEARFPWLAANVYRTNGEVAYQPYLVRQIGPIKVGVVGLVTPAIPYWETKQNYAGLEFHEPIPEARKWVAALREKERADVVIVAMHMGLDRDPATGRMFSNQLPHENEAFEIAEQVPGVDVILMGHTHRNVPELLVNGVLLTQAQNWGMRLARVDLELERNANGRWKIAGKHGQTLSVKGVDPDPAILALAKPYHDETQKWLNTPIGAAGRAMDGKNARFEDTAIMDLIQRVQLEYTKADVSIAAMFNTDARIEKGPVTVRQIAGLYIYENTPVAIRITGKQLRETLEHSAEYFLAYEPGKTIHQLINREIPGYQFDMAEGVDYVIDLTKPAGQRITSLTFKGQPLRDDQPLVLATNSYRSAGGGGYSMLKDAPVVSRSAEEMRNLIIEYVTKHKLLDGNTNHNWRIVPEGVVK